MAPPNRNEPDADVRRSRVVGELASELAGVLPPADIERLADETLQGFEGVPVRDFIEVLAMRRVRKHAHALRQRRHLPGQDA